MPEEILTGRGASPGVAWGVTTSLATRQAEASGVLLLPALTREDCIGIPEGIIAVIAGAGGVGSHGAALLRERNIPCVILPAEEFQKFKNGQNTKVDGGRGVVYVQQSGTTIADEPASIPPPLRIRTTPLAILRPDRQYQKLRFDLLRRGWEESPKFLFGMQECRLVLNDRNVIEAVDGPNLSDIGKFILEEIDWFFSIASQREIEVERIKAALPSYIADVNSSSSQALLRSLEALRELYTALLRYIYLTQFISEILLKDWLDLSEKVSGDAAAYIQSFLRCEYTQRSLTESDYPGRSTFWTLPSRDPKVWQGRIRWNQSSEDDPYFLRASLTRSLTTRSALLSKFGQYRLVVPMIYQMAEEHFFVSSSISSFMNRAVDQSSHIIVGREAASEERQTIYNLSYENLINALANTRQGG